MGDAAWGWGMRRKGSGNILSHPTGLPMSVWMWPCPMPLAGRWHWRWKTAPVPLATVVPRAR